MWNSILENLLVMILSIVFLVGGAYCLLVVLGWGLRLKSKGHEQAGLTDLWIKSQKQASSQDEIAEKADTKG